MLAEKPKTSRNLGHSKRGKTTYQGTCSSCGGNAVVPFVPISGKDIFCSDCFSIHKQDGMLPKRFLADEEKNYEGVFADLDLMPSTRLSLARMGSNTPTPIQQATIPLLQDGYDVIGQARTGSGKLWLLPFQLLKNLIQR